jgi:hypothetical protein
MAGYAKVFDSLLTSSLWCHEHYVIRIWIAMLARCNQQGVVEGSIPGFASLCRVTREELEHTLEVLLAPDPDSRTPDRDGRRLEVVPGGWRILNYKAYRARGQEKEGSKAPFMRTLREVRKAPAHRVTEGNELPGGVTGDPTATAGTDVPPTGVVPPARPRAPKPDLEPLRQEVLGHWKAVAVPAGLPDVLKGTSAKLQAAMNARLKDPAWLPLFREAVDYAARHPAAGWMRGEGDRQWKVSLEWLLKPDKAEETAARARAAPGRARGIGADASTQAQVQQLPTRKLAPLPPTGAP